MKRDLFRHLRGIAAANGAGLSWGYSPEEAKYPRIVLRRTATRPEYHTRGESGFAESTVQITVYAIRDQQRSASKRTGEIADQVRAAMSGFTGPMGDTYVHSCELSSEFDVEEQPLGGDWVLGVVQEYDIAHGKAVGAKA